MSKIKILPENVANQIAAGEVIERPASVVKECLENAVDAGAGRIVIQVEGDGSRLIRVIDDGEGMDEDDILLSLERHATSKLEESGQLSAIRTLGFRGEAIPSIASVSRMTITSRTAGAPLGHRVEIRYGQIRKVHEMGASPGTSIEIRDLFGNVPARRKFLKSARTELSHIEEIVIHCALAYADLGLVYTVNGREVRRFPAAGEDLAARLRKVMGRAPASPLINVQGERAAVPSLSVRGFLIPPDEGLAGASRLRLFVNLRPVRDRMISHAVAEGMHAFLMKGRRPAGAIFIHIDPEAVDVNVHPTKQEIRFHRSSLVHDTIVEAVKRGMVDFQRNLHFAVFGSRDKDASRPGRSVEVSRPAAETIPPPAPAREADRPSGRGELREPAPLFSASPDPRPEPPVPEPEKTQPPPVPGPRIPQQMPEEAGAREEATAAPARLRYVAQFLNSYLLCEAGDGGIVVIDQHAAHERLIYERLKKQYSSRAIPAQTLLFPEIIECTPAQAEVLDGHRMEIERLGIAIDEFGGDSYAIKAIPAPLRHLGPLEIIKGIFDHYLDGEGKGKGSAARIEDILAVMACKAAVKAHDELHPEEGRELLRKMEEADVFSHCPHGRPVLKAFSGAEIRKWFHR